jgi:hypothetical protein
MGRRMGFAMRRRTVPTSVGAATSGARLLVAGLLSLALLPFVISPVSAQADVVDAGLDTIMKLSPAGFQRAQQDRLPTGPMSTVTFNAIGFAAVPVLGNNAVFYGASYERSDGALIVFLGMSTSEPQDGQRFVDAIAAQAIPNGIAFSPPLARAVGVEATANGVPATAVAFVRNGRGLAVLSFGATGRDSGATFATFVAGVAASTPTRRDAKSVSKLQPVAVAIAAAIALAVTGIGALWRFARHRTRDSSGRGRSSRRRPPRGSSPPMRHLHPTDTLEHPVPAPPRPSPRPNPR